MPESPYLDIRQVISIFQSSGEERMFYETDSTGHAINFAQRFNTMRKKDKEYYGDHFVKYDNISVSPVRGTAQVCIQYLLNSEGLPKGRFILPDGREYVPPIPETLDPDLSDDDLADQIAAVQKLIHEDPQ